MKKSICVLLSMILTLCSVSSLSLGVSAEHYDYFECDVVHTVESGTSFWFCAEEDGMYEFTSCNNFDPRLTVVFEDDTSVTYDDVDFDNLNYEFGAIIQLEAGEEIFCTIEDGEGYDVDFYITRYYDELCADEEYQVYSGFEFKFIAEQDGTYNFYSFENYDPVLIVEYEDGTVETFDDDAEREFDAFLFLEEGEEIICTVSDYSDSDINFGIYAYSNLYADEEYTVDSGFEFFFTAKADGFYRFFSYENEGDPNIEILYDGEEIYFDDDYCYSYEFDGGIYLEAGDYIFATVNDNHAWCEDGCVVTFAIEYWGDECPGHRESDWYVGEEATVYNPGYAYTVCEICGVIVETETIPQLKPATPKLTKIANTASGVKVTWSAVEGADNYIVYRRTYKAKTKAWSGWSKLKAGVTSTSYLDKTAKSGTYYIYTVKANNEAGYGGHTSGLKTYFLSTPKLASIANASGKVTVKWSKVSGAKGYIVYRRTYNASTKTWGGWSKLATTKSNAYNDTKAKSGTYYRYTVRAYYGDYTSYFDTTGLQTKFLSMPKLSTVTSAKSGVTVKWGKVAGATGYIVYRKTGNGGWQKIATVKGNAKVSYLDKTAKKGTTYTYTVKAYSGSYKSAHNTTGLIIKDKY